MEAKDTVIGIDLIIPKFTDYVPSAVYGLLDEQSEISFKLGKQVGRKEVVEFVGEYIFPLLTMSKVSVSFKDKWNDQLEKWQALQESSQ